ncbi:MAG: hypothetical protein MZV63_21520 [Marinilabiliales bacterium]|nr:hypothetical protein [Marinilabiliales bacterium]
MTFSRSERSAHHGLQVGKDADAYATNTYLWAPQISERCSLLGTRQQLDRWQPGP